MNAKDKLSRNFTLGEFACNDGTPVPSEYLNNAARLARQLQVIRGFFNAPVTINSAYRTIKYNAQVGGAKDSQHLECKAADIVVKGYSAQQVRKAIEGLIRIGALKDGGVGAYPDFTHYDIRDKRARW